MTAAAVASLRPRQRLRSRPRARLVVGRSVSRTRRSSGCGPAARRSGSGARRPWPTIRPWHRRSTKLRRSALLSAALSATCCCSCMTMVATSAISLRSVVNCDAAASSELSRASTIARACSLSSSRAFMSINSARKARKSVGSTPTFLPIFIGLAAFGGFGGSGLGGGGASCGRGGSTIGSNSSSLSIASSPVAGLAPWLLDDDRLRLLAEQTHLWRSLLGVVIEMAVRYRTSSTPTRGGAVR